MKKPSKSFRVNFRRNLKMVVFLGDLCYNKIPEALKIKDLCKLQIRPLGHGIRRPSVQICTPQPDSKIFTKA